MREAECLHLCPRGQSQQSSSCEAFFDFVVASAPKVKVLCLSHWSNSRGSGFPYFHNLVGGAQFAQLQELHLFLIEATFDELRDLLRAVAPTLQRLTLGSITLNDNFRFTEWKIDEAQQLWHRAWALMKDDLSLQFLSMSGLACREVEVQVIGRGRHLSGGRSNSGPRRSRTVIYKKEYASISFEQWVTALKANPFIEAESEGE
jgi:hypothetical protein